MDGDALNQVRSLLLLCVALMGVLILAVTWSRFAAQPFVVKLLLLAFIAAVCLIVAVTQGWVTTQQVQLKLQEASEQANHYWKVFDGLTRTYPWLGVVLLCVVPLLMWPRE